tara:strand:- start:819 stop:1544 length:726 start_codon:yes stop_codon:yes gene_type:complete
VTGYIFVLVAGLAAGTLSGVVGTGGSIILMPILVYQFGPQQAVPIMAIAAVLGNVGKAVAWWREVDWRAFWAYSILGVPAAALGARTLLVLPPHVVEVVLGGFFLLMIPGRRWMQARDFKIRYWQLAIIGGVIGYLSGIVLSTGPLSIPAFLAIGLTKGALISTEAAASLALMVSKVATFQQLGALPGPLAIQGAIIGASMMAGAYLGKKVMARMSLSVFEHVMDVMLFCSGVALLWTAIK